MQYKNRLLPGMLCTFMLGLTLVGMTGAPILNLNSALASALPTAFEDGHFDRLYAGDCNTDNIPGCVRYALDGAGATLGEMTWLDLLAITYYGELAIYTANEDLRMVSYEALARSFFDSQSGACRFNHDPLLPAFACTRTNALAWLQTTQHWRDSVLQKEGVIWVNIPRLFGVATDGSWKYLEYKQPLLDSVNANLNTWQTGQGKDVPSMWGNTRLEPGATIYTGNTDETMGVLIVHYYPDRRATFGDSLPEMPSCTLASIIVTTQGRFPQGVSGCQ